MPCVQNNIIIYYMLLIIILLLIIIINLMNVYFRKENFENINNNVKDCIVEWDNNYGPCSASCGGGTQIRI